MPSALSGYIATDALMRVSNANQAVNQCPLWVIEASRRLHLAISCNSLSFHSTIKSFFWIVILCLKTPATHYRIATSQGLIISNARELATISDHSF